MRIKKRKSDVRPKPPLKLFVECPGDRSVGIWPSQLKITIEGALGNLDNEQLEYLRERLKETFANLIDDHVGVLYEGECPDCGRKNCKGECCTYGDDL